MVAHFWLHWPQLHLGLIKEQYLTQPLATGGFGHFSPASEAPPVLALRFRSVGSHPALARVLLLCLGCLWAGASVGTAAFPLLCSSPSPLLFPVAWQVAELWVTAVLLSPGQGRILQEMLPQHKFKLFGCSSLDSEWEMQHITSEPSSSLEPHVAVQG